MQQGMPGNAPPKKGMSGLMIALIIVGVIFVLILGTCVGGYFFVSHEAKKLEADLQEGGLVLVSPPAVKDALAGPKKDYVGHWTSKRGSSLDIDADGNMKLDKDEDGDGNKESITAPISAFVGDDFQVKLVVVLTMHVSQPPKQEGGKWATTVDGIHFSR